MSYLASNQALASWMASMRICFVFAFGSKGLPRSMPMVLSGSIIALSRSSHGSACTIVSSDSKKLRS